MTAPINSQTIASIGLPGDAYETTTAEAQSLPDNKGSLTHLLDRFCNAVDAEIRSVGKAYGNYDRPGVGVYDKVDKGLGALFSGIGGSVTLMASSLLRGLPHPIVTATSIVTGFPEAIVQMGDAFVASTDKIGDGQYVEGAFDFGMSAGNIVALLMGGESMLTSVSSVAKTGATALFSEITAAAEAVSAGSGPALATASGVYASSGAAAAVRVAASAMPSAALLTGSGLMCMASEGAGATDGAAQAPLEQAPQPMTLSEVAEHIFKVVLFDIQKQLQLWVGEKATYTIVELTPERIILDTSAGKRITFLKVDDGYSSYKPFEVADYIPIPPKKKLPPPRDFGVPPRQRFTVQTAPSSSGSGHYYAAPSEHTVPFSRGRIGAQDEQFARVPPKEARPTQRHHGRRQGEPTGSAGLSPKRLEHIQNNPPAARRDPRPRQEADIYGRVTKKSE